MLVQVGSSSILVWSFIIFYAVFLWKPLNVDERYIFSLILSITNLFYYLNYAKSFYIYTLSSGMFRSIYIQRVKCLVQRVSTRR